MPDRGQRHSGSYFFAVLQHETIAPDARNHTETGDWYAPRS
jgi:hypothetical protein